VENVKIWQGSVYLKGWQCNVRTRVYWCGCGVVNWQFVWTHRDSTFLNSSCTKCTFQWFQVSVLIHLCGLLIVGSRLVTGVHIYLVYISVKYAEGYQMSLFGLDGCLPLSVNRLQQSTQQFHIYSIYIHKYIIIIYRVVFSEGWGVLSRNTAGLWTKFTYVWI